MSHYDAIVVGGGPAGSLTAWHLATAGCRVLVLEAKAFPRAKACGGGLQARVIPELPLDIGSVVRGRLSDVTLTFGLRDAHTRQHSDTLVYTVLRSEFDEHLLRCAQQAGAVIRERTRVNSLSIADNGRVTVVTDNGSLSADCLVGADGANSVVRNQFNARETYFWQAAVYCEVPEHLIDPRVIERQRMYLDWGTLPSGYAWAFPKDGFVNVGTGAPVQYGRHLRQYASAFVHSLGLLRPGAAEQLTFTGHQLPTLTSQSQVAHRSVLLVGDAAGLVEPFTGEGLFFACQSASIAARSILKALSSGVRDLSSYSSELLPAVKTELACSRALLRFSTIFPKRVYHLFRSNDQAWRTLCRVLRGEESFQQLAGEMLGPLRIAAKAVDAVSALIEPMIMRTRMPARPFAG
jgi:geranylgeranyl reductase family protein